MHDRPPAIPGMMPPVGNTCASLGPDNAKTCYDDWVIQQQLAAAPPGATGAGCAVVSPDGQHDCINDYILDNVPGAWRCGRTPEEVQACLYTAMDNRRQCPGLTPSPAPAASPAVQTCDNSAIPEDFQSCIFGWVATQQLKALPSGSIGGGCGSLGPLYYKSCLNDWVWQNLPDAPARCGCAPADRLQACFNKVVDDKMHDRPPAIPGMMPPVGNTCASLGPDNAKTCYDDWVIQQQLAAAPPGATGAGCAVVSPDGQQDCINDYIRDNLPGAWRCGGAPEGEQACLYAAVDNRRQGPGLTPSPAPAASPAVPTGVSCGVANGPGTAALEYRSCINNWVNQKVFAQLPPVSAGVADDRLGCYMAPWQWSNPSSPMPTFNQDCINRWVVENLVVLKPDAGSVGPANVAEGCTFGAVQVMARRHRRQLAASKSMPMPDTSPAPVTGYGVYESWQYVLVSPDTHTFQECVDSVVERAMVAPVPPAKPCGSDPHSPEYRSCIDSWVNQKLFAQLPPPPAGVADDCLGCYMAPWQWSSSSPMPTYNQDCINRWVVENLVCLKPDAGSVGPANVAEGCTFGAVRVMARRHRRLTAGNSMPMPDTSSAPSTGYGDYDSGWQYVLVSSDTHTFQECVDGVAERAMAAGNNPMSPAPNP